MPNITPPILHRLVKDNIPDLPIKQDCFWVGILTHDISDTSKVTDGRAFVFVKANSRITVRTVKYKYFERHGLEDFVLQHENHLPDEMTTMGQLGHLRPRDNVIALRALERDEIKDSLLLEDLARNDEDIRQLPRFLDPIVIDDDNRGREDQDRESSVRFISERGGQLAHSHSIEEEETSEDDERLNDVGDDQHDYNEHGDDDNHDHDYSHDENTDDEIGSQRDDDSISEGHVSRKRAHVDDDEEYDPSERDNSDNEYPNQGDDERDCAESQAEQRAESSNDVSNVDDTMMNGEHHISMHMIDATAHLPMGITFNDDAPTAHPGLNNWGHTFNPVLATGGDNIEPPPPPPSTSFVFASDGRAYGPVSNPPSWQHNTTPTPFHYHHADGRVYGPISNPPDWQSDPNPATSDPVLGSSPIEHETLVTAPQTPTATPPSMPLPLPLDSIKDLLNVDSDDGEDVPTSSSATRCVNPNCRVPLQPDEHIERIAAHLPLCAGCSVTWRRVYNDDAALRAAEEASLAPPTGDVREEASEEGAVKDIAGGFSALGTEQ